MTEDDYSGVRDTIERLVREGYPRMMKGETMTEHTYTKEEIEDLVQDVEHLNARVAQLERHREMLLDLLSDLGDDDDDGPDEPPEDPPPTMPLGGNVIPIGSRIGPGFDVSYQQLMNVC